MINSISNSMAFGGRKYTTSDAVSNNRLKAAQKVMKDHCDPDFIEVKGTSSSLNSKYITYLSAPPLVEKEVDKILKEEFGDQIKIEKVLSPEQIKENDQELHPKLVAAMQN